MPMVCPDGLSARWPKRIAHGICGADLRFVRDDYFSERAHFNTTMAMSLMLVLEGCMAAESLESHHATLHNSRLRWAGR